MEIEKERPDVKLSNFIEIIMGRTKKLLERFGPNRLLDINASFKEQLDNLEDIWFSQETMSKILYQKERIFKCEKAKVDGAHWEINFAESIKDDLNKLDEEKLTKIVELLKRVSLLENPRIEGCLLDGGFWRYEVGDEVLVPRGCGGEIMLTNILRITCSFDISKSSILVLRISPPYKSEEELGCYFLG